MVLNNRRPTSTNSPLRYLHQRLVALLHMMSIDTTTMNTYFQTRASVCNDAKPPQAGTYVTTIP